MFKALLHFYHSMAIIGVLLTNEFSWIYFLIDKGSVKHAFILFKTQRQYDYNLIKDESSLLQMIKDKVAKDKGDMQLHYKQGG